MESMKLGKEDIALVYAELAEKAERTAGERNIKKLQDELDQLESLSGADALELSRHDGWFYIRRADGTGPCARVPDGGTSTDELLHRPFHDCHEMIAARKRVVRAELAAITAERER